AAGRRRGRWSRWSWLTSLGDARPGASGRLLRVPKAVQQRVQVGTAKGSYVERSVVVRLERVPPQDGEDERGEDAVSDVIDVDRPELPGLDALAEDRPQQGQSAVGDLFEVEPGQVGEVAGLGQDEFGQDAHPRREDVGGPDGEEALDEFSGRHVGR